MKPAGSTLPWASDREVTVTARGPERFAQLYSQYAPAAARLAFLLTDDRQLAEDITQEAFVKVLGRYADLRSQAAFHAYLRTTIVNLARGHFRKLRVERSWLERQKATDVERTASQPEIEMGDDLWRRMATLPYRQRVALVLRYYEDLSENETADVMHCSSGAVKSLIARAMATLRGQTWDEEG